MNILFIGSVYDDTQKELFLRSSKRGYQFASQNLQESLIEGFLANSVNLTVLSRPSLSTFPFGCRLPYVKSVKYCFRGMELGRSMNFINLPFVKNQIQYQYESFIEEWYKNTSGNKYLFTYAIIKDGMRACIKAKQRHPDLKISIIMPDLPKYMGVNKYYKMLGFQRRDIEQITNMLPCFDAYFPLAEPMMKDLGLIGKKYRVIEGIFSPEETENVAKFEKKTILYTGKATPRYGLLKLVKAFKLIKSENYQLLIRGNGMTNDLIDEIKQDARISILNPMSKKDLLELEQRATMLINPVPPSEEFTKYFFPSKTMDYIASGTPTLMYDLECLPFEYRNHLVLLEDESIDTLKRKIIEVCEWDEEKKVKWKQKAQEFIYTKKNAKVQVKKIIEVLETII